MKVQLSAEKPHGKDASDCVGKQHDVCQMLSLTHYTFARNRAVATSCAILHTCTVASWLLVTQGSAFSYSTAAIREPPRSSPVWRPATVMRHMRPILAMYMGFDADMSEAAAIASANRLLTVQQRVCCCFLSTSAQAAALSSGRHGSTEVNCHLSACANISRCHALCQQCDIVVGLAGQQSVCQAVGVLRVSP